MRRVKKMNSRWQLVRSPLATVRLPYAFAAKNGPLQLAYPCARFGTSLPGRLMDCFFRVCFWFSLPLSIWLTSGWIGLILHWQALSPERPASWRRSFAGKNRPFPECTSVE
jgi:hypothetical protein